MNNMVKIICKKCGNKQEFTPPKGVCQPFEQCKKCNNKIDVKDFCH